MNQGDILSFGKNKIKNVHHQAIPAEVQDQQIEESQRQQLKSRSQQNKQQVEKQEKQYPDINDINMTFIPQANESQKSIKENKQHQNYQAQNDKIKPLNEKRIIQRINSSSSKDAPKFVNQVIPTKSQKMEALRQKIGIQQSKTSTFSNGGKIKREGILKIAIQKLSAWMNNTWEQCRKRKHRNAKQSDSTSTTLHVKSSFKDPSKRRQGLSGKNRSKDDGERSQSSGGEDNGTSTKDGSAYLKKDSVRQSVKSKRNSTISNDQLKIDREIQMLRDAVKIMSKEKMMQKAFRHLMDGLLYRSVRHDLDRETSMSKFILFIWRIQNSSLWNDFLLFLGWVYIFMSFFEPSSRNEGSLPYQSFFAMVCIESTILILQTADLMMEIIQRSTQEDQNIFKFLISRKKNFFRFLFFLLNTSDLIYYVISYPINTFRFARIFRPLQIIIFSKSLRRNFQGIINSAKNLLMILFFDVIITFFWAYIGVNMIGDLYEDPTVDTFAVDFRVFLKAANELYIFSSLDQYPDILFPAVTNSMLYLFYFLPYLIMFLLLFAPIPVAVVYEGFRKHRLNLLIADRIKRRKALWACFQCIVSDSKKSYIEKPDFVQFFNYVYQKVELDETAELISDVLWSELDANDNKKVSIEEFFTVIDFTEQRKEFRLQRIKPFLWWAAFRENVQNKYDLVGMLQGSKFEIISFLVTIGSCTITLIGLFSDINSDNYPFIDIIEKSIFGFFALEVILKMVAYGPNNFFDESWNVFDLFLVLFQAFFDFIFDSFMKGSNVKSFSASRVLKIAKLQKIFRMFRAFRTVKVLNYILSGLDIIKKVYEMLYKIVICIPIVMKLSVIIIIVFYIYAAIGVELFSTKLRKTYPSEYADFSTFGGAILILLQVCVGSGWGNILFDFGKRFNDLTTSAIYFNSFHFLSVFVLSLIGGLVWEVFDVVERIMRDQQAYEQQLEIQRQWEEQQQQMEASFQSLDYIKKNPSLSQSQNKRGSLMVSLKSVSTLMKLPLISQKISMKGSSHTKNREGIHQDDDDDEEDDNYSPKADYQDPKLNGVVEGQSPFNEGRVESKKSITNKDIQMDESLNKNKNSIDSIDSDNEMNSSDDEDNNSSSDDDSKEENGEEEEDNDLVYGEENSNYQENNEEKSSQRSEKLEQSDQFIHTKDQNHDNTDYQNKQKQFFNTKSDAISHNSEQISFMNESKGQSLSDKKIQMSLQFKGQKTASSTTSQKKVKSWNKNSHLKQSDSQNQKQVNKAVEKMKKLKKKGYKKRRKLRVENDLAMIFRQQCYIDNQAMSQRDKSQLILYQDIFRLSTLDQFFRNSPFKVQVPIEETEQNVNKFHIIREEEEDEYEQNGSSLFQKIGQNNGISKRMTNSIASKLIGVDEEEDEMSDQQQDNLFNTDECEQQQQQLSCSFGFGEQKEQKIQEKQSQFSAKKISQRSSKYFNNTFDIQAVIKEEELDEHTPTQTLFNTPLHNLQNINIYPQRKSQSAEKEVKKTKYQQIRPSYINNSNVLNKLNDTFSHTRHISLEKDIKFDCNNHILQNKLFQLERKSSEQSMQSIQLIKINSQDFSQYTKENEINSKTFPRNSLQSPITNQIKQLTEQQYQKSSPQFWTHLKEPQDNKKQSLESYKQRNSDQGYQFSPQIEKQGSKTHSRFSSIGGLIIVDASQNTITQNNCSPVQSSSSSLSNSKSSSPSHIQQQEYKELSTKMDNKSEKNQELFEYIEQADSPQQKSHFKERKYYPSKKIRDEHDLQPEQGQFEQDYQGSSTSAKQSSLNSDVKVQSLDRKSLFGQQKDDKHQQTPTSSSPQNKKNDKIVYNNIDIHKKNDKQNVYSENSMQAHDNSRTTNYQNSDTNLTLESNKIKSNLLQADNDDNDVIRGGKREISTIPEQSSHFEQDFCQSCRITEQNNQSKIIQKDGDVCNTNLNTLRSRNSIIGGNIDGSDCIFINNTFEEQHNIAIESLPNNQGYQINKDLKYANFKHDIEAQNDQSKLEGENNMNEINKEELEQSFIEEMNQMQSGVFEEELKISKRQKRQKKNQLHQQSREKHRQELLKYYQSNLVDINFQIEYNSNQNTLISNQIGLKQKQNGESKAQRDIILDKPKNIQMKNNLLNINQDLRNEQQTQMKIDLDNKNFIINKAILKQVDQNKIQKIELRHFRQLYGKQFEDMLDNDIFPLWNQQAKLLFHFDNILKYDYIPMEQFMQIYCSLELQLSSLLMNKFSSFKIIFQDYDDKWFTVNFVQEAFFLQDVEKQGPWQFYESLFEGQKSSILKHRNIFNYKENNQNIKKKLKKFFQLSQDISNNFYFRKLQINQKRSDIVYIPFSNDNPDQTQKMVLDIIQKTPNLPEYITKDDLSLNMIPRIKKGLAVAYLFDNPVMKERKRQFTSEHINIEQAIVEEDLIAQELLNSTLNYTYSIELLKDMKNHIIMNKEMLFKKISQFYFYRSCFERNFCSITEIPFEQ